jgi:cyclophilin family peptidyl-prolyl cis-trans isomerase
VGTDKRERQKANRAMRQQQASRAETRRRGLRIGLVVVGAVVAVFAVVWVAGRVMDDGDDTATDAGGTANEAFSTDDSTAGTGDAGAADSVAATEPEVLVDAPECPPEGGAETPQQTFAAAPAMCIDPAVQYDAVVTTNKGEFTIELDAEQAPQTVNNFVFLSRYGYYDDTLCHRIIPEFVVQCGDPTGTGTGGPGYQFDDELPEEGAYEIGSVAMANSGPNTNGSQFFIITGDQGVALPTNNSLFGTVTAGFDEAVRAMEAAGSPSGEPTEEVDIVSVEIVER